jgi:16S rRNA (cytosine967-C5)-methyltransferase
MRPPRKNRPAGKGPRPARPPGQGGEAPRPEVAGWQARLAAAEILTLTLDEGLDLEAALDKSKTYRGLEGADRGFARAIAGAALRGVGRIGWALGGMVDRPIAEIEAPVRALLFAGAAQLWMLGVKDHAAVSATVEAARRWKASSRAGGLLNAVLRRAAREAEAFQATPPTAVWPDWLAGRLKASLGPERADAMALLQLEEPATDLSLKKGPAAAAEWAEKLGGVALPNGSVRLEAGGRLEALPGYSEGEWWVQDAAAAVAVGVMGDVRGAVVADLCAAPGGKAMQLAAAGARVLAVDVSRQRLVRVRENAARVGLAMEVVEADARVWRPEALVDAVLLDAPCSALGVMRRHPEGVWRRDARDMARFPAVQRALVDAAREMVRVGGRLVYCVCTPVPEEGVEVVEAVLAAGGWARAPVRAEEAPGFEQSLTAVGDVFTAPHVVAMSAAPPDHTPRKSVADPVKSDVFYIARLERLPD